MERWFTPIVIDQNLTVHFKFETSVLDMERWLIPPIIFANQISHW